MAKKPQRTVQIASPQPRRWTSPRSVKALCHSKNVLQAMSIYGGQILDAFGVVQVEFRRVEIPTHVGLVIFPTRIDVYVHEPWKDGPTGMIGTVMPKPWRIINRGEPS